MLCVFHFLKWKVKRENVKELIMNSKSETWRKPKIRAYTENNKNNEDKDESYYIILEDSNS